MGEKERGEKARQLATTLGITEQLKSLPKEVSGGQAERACIARALLLGPKVILADEPTSNLDETNARVVFGILEQIRLHLGVTIVVASHDRMATQFATEVAQITNGVVRAG